MSDLQQAIERGERRMLESSPHLQAVKAVQGDIQVRLMRNGGWLEWRTLILPISDDMAGLLLAPHIGSILIRYNNPVSPEAMEWRLAP